MTTATARRIGATSAGLLLLAGCYSQQVVLSRGDGGEDDGIGDPLGVDAGVPGSEWTFGIVDQAADDGESVALAVDEEGNPHLHYMWSDNTGDELHHEIRYATKTGDPVHPGGGNWEIDTLSPAPGTHVASAMAIAPDGTIQLAWVRHDYDPPVPPESFLCRSYGGDGRWVTEELLGPAEIMNVAMALDAAGAMHIAYTLWEDCARGDRPCSWVRHATDARGAWAIEDVDPGTEGASPAIAIDPDGEPRIAYLAGEDFGEVRVARHDAAGWHPERAADASPDPAARGGRAIANWGTIGLVVDDAGANHVFAPGGAVTYATDTDGAWHSELVAEPADRGAYYPTAVLDSTGALHVAWMIVGFGGGGFLRTDIALASGWDGAWTVETVVAGMDWVDSDLAFAIDAQDRLHLAYVDAQERVAYGVRAP